MSEDFILRGIFFWLTITFLKILARNENELISRQNINIYVKYFYMMKCVISICVCDHK